MNKSELNNAAVGYELIITPSGKYYQITQSDITLMTNRARQVFERQAGIGTKVGLFLNLDSLQLMPLIIYNALIECGANVVRCGLSDIERQLTIFGDDEFDFVITTQASWKHLCDRVKYREVILIRSEVDSIPPENRFCLFELYDIPGFLIWKNDSVICPGYIVKNERGYIVLATESKIEGFHIERYRTNKSHQCNAEKHSGIVSSYIHSQVVFLLNHLGKFTEGSLDSLGMVELLIALEEEFEINIPLSKVQRNDLADVDSMTKFIRTILMEKNDEL